MPSKKPLRRTSRKNPDGLLAAQAKKEKKASYSVEDLLVKAAECVDNMQLEMAAKFYRRALEMSPTDTNIMDSLADVLMQVGENEEAFQLLMKSVTEQPTLNPHKWCSLAQLQCGLESLSTFQRAIEILKEHRKQLVSPDDLRLNQKQIARAFCSIAELYMTDLCFEPNAETACESAILSSLEVENENLDALQTYASFRISQSRPIDAGSIMETVYMRTKPMRDQMNSKTIIQEIASSNDEPNVPEDLPDDIFFVATAKLLIECSTAHPPLAEMAIELLQDLLNHDDENIELWYLMGVVAQSLPIPDWQTSQYHLERAHEMLKVLKTNAQACNEEFLFSTQMELVLEHLQILAANAPATKRHGNDNLMDDENNVVDDMAVEDDEEWSSCDEDEDNDKM